MSNYTKDNLLAISKEDVPVGSLAIKIGGEVFPVTVQSKGGVDTSDATALASDILIGKTAYVNGELVTGTIPNLTDSFFSLEPGTSEIPLGGYADHISVSVAKVHIEAGPVSVTPSKETQVITPQQGTYYNEVTVNPIPDEYIITTDATAIASDILKGKTAYVGGKKVDGEMPHAFVTEREFTYVIDPGYVETTITLAKTETSRATAQQSDVSVGVTFYNKDGYYEGTMPDSSPYRDENIVIIPAGRIREQQLISVGVAAPGTTALPSTSPQILATAGSYLVGNIVVEGDPNLKPENIVSGVSIFGVAGTATQGNVSESSGATVNANVVTVGKGYLAEDLTVTIPMGVLSATDGGAGWTLGEGYYREQSLDVPKGSITIGDGVVTTTQGYIGRKELTIPSGSVSVNTVDNKVVVTKGYVTSQEIPLTGDGGATSQGFYKCSEVIQWSKIYTVYGSTVHTQCDGEYTLTNLRSPVDSEVYKHETEDIYYWEVPGGPAYIGRYDTGEGCYFTNPLVSDPAYNWEGSGGGTTNVSVRQLEESRWSGYKAVMSSDGVYTFSDELTDGLTYGSAFTPVVGNVYNNGCTIIAQLYIG